MKISIVIPTYNERDNIKELIGQIFTIHDPRSTIQVIVVDDSSDDGTIDAVRSLRKHFPITFILRPKKLGLGSALKDGLSLAMSHSADLAITMDADLSHNPDCILKMFDEVVKKQADVVVGSRRVQGGSIQGWGLVRLFMSRSAMEFARQILRIKTKDVTSGFRAYRRQVLESIDLTKLKSTGYAFQEEMLYRAEQKGFRVVEIPIQFTDRRQGKSKLGIRDIVEFFITVIYLRFSYVKK